MFDEKKISLQQKILLVDIRGREAFCFGGNNTIIIIIIIYWRTYIIDLHHTTCYNPFLRGFALLDGLALIESFILRTKQAMQYVIVVELLIEQSKPIRKNEQNKWRTLS